MSATPQDWGPPASGCAARRTARRSLQANSDLFSWRCRVARRPIRGNAIRTQTGGTRGNPRDLAPDLVSASPKWAHGSIQPATPVAGFSALCRLRDRSYVVGSTQLAPVTALMRRVRMDVEAAMSWATAGKYARNIGRLVLL